MIQQTTRAFTDTERAHIESLLRRRPSHPLRGLGKGLFIGVVATLVTMILVPESYLSWPAHVLVGVIAGDLAFVKVRFWPRESSSARLYQADLVAGIALVQVVRAREAVRVEEVEDEGSQYLIGLTDDRGMFLFGQDLYDCEEERRFPCREFEVVLARHSWVARARVMESVEPTSRTGVINDLKRALAADSTNGEAWFLLGRAREDLLDSAGARVAYERGVALAPTNVEALAFFALHYHGAGSPANGLKWADSALAIEPTYELARAAALLLSIEARDWRLAERHLLALYRVLQGRGRVAPLSHAARIAALKGDRAGSRRLALTAERLVDSTSLTRHEAVWLGHAFSSAGDTARAYRWLAVFSPRDDVHFQLHLHRDPALAWVRDPRYRRLLSSP